MEQQLKSQTPVASYMIDNPIERAKMWIVEQEEKMLLESKVVIDFKLKVINSSIENMIIAATV